MASVGKVEKPSPKTDQKPAKQPSSAKKEKEQEKTKTKKEGKTKPPPVTPARKLESDFDEAAVKQSALMANAEVSLASVLVVVLAVCGQNWLLSLITSSALT